LSQQTNIQLFYWHIDASSNRGAIRGRPASGRAVP
jgi:hypothetical protein